MVIEDMVAPFIADGRHPSPAFAALLKELLANSHP